MTRPKVPPDQRQRTAQACDSCKRRKQKCNGLCPCNTCEKRKFICVYGDRDSPSGDEEPALKRQATEGDISNQNDPNDLDRHDVDGLHNDIPSGVTHELPNTHQQSSITSPYQPRPSLTGADPFAFARNGSHKKQEQPLTAADENAARSLQQFSTMTGGPANTPYTSRATSQDGQDEEAVVYTQTRMLQDPTGRLLYVGDSATLSFLQLLRMMVENVAGPSPFTTDPRRHKIMESQFSLPSSTQHTHLLPDKRTAFILADAFFINTHGFIQVFERQPFLTSLEATFLDPLSAEPSWLCLLNLVFAIGLMLATPRQGTAEAAVIAKLRNEKLDRAELFYLNAKGLHDPLTGFEDADFWSVQALLLMATYMLAKSKRNTAFALLGMAVRSAYALGLHREETMVIFSPDEQNSRRNLWRSLFVVDRFLSCSLGRPSAISEDDCSGNTLRPAEPEDVPDTFGFNTGFSASIGFAQTGSLALEAAVRSCSVIGTILKKVYQQRRISTKLAQDIADVCKLWPKALAPVLHWRQAPTATPSQGIAILHVNMFYCHSIILLTRPFFLFILNAEIQKGMNHDGDGSQSRRNFAKMEKFGEACVIASTHTIVLVQNALEAGYLPRRNPTVIYFLLAAAVVLVANEFAALYTNAAADQCIRNAITTMTYCSETDPQATRLLYILTTFRDVALQQQDRRRRHRQSQASLLSVLQQPQNIYAYPGVQQPTNDQGVRRTSYGQQVQPDVVSASATEGAFPTVRTPTVNLGMGVSNSEQAQHTATGPINHEPGPTGPVTAHIPAEEAQVPNHLDDTTMPSHTANAMLLSPPAADAAAAAQTPLSGLPSLERHMSVSNLLDTSIFDTTKLPSLRSEDSSGPDEHFDFDALWAWPSNTPVVGSPRYSGGVQGISDSAVPLFGVVEQ